VVRARIWWQRARPQQVARSQRQNNAGFAGSGLLCILQTVGMPVRLHHIVIDAHDLPGLARFWTQALGWKILSEREREIVIGTDENAPVGICFMPVNDPKTVKNRVHLDLTSSAADRLHEIDRLVALGARRVDIGQTGAESWTVLADPEGNEFCVVRPKETLIR
jgi:predicted enzyme related to lactoylglutathione lyase